MRFGIWLLLLVAVGCMKHATGQVEGYGAEEGVGDFRERELTFAPEDVMGELKRAERPSPKRSPSHSEPLPPAAGPSDTPAQGDTAPLPAPDRMVHYDGHVRLRVTRPDEAADQIATIATGMGGRVERLTATYVTVRVPVDRFNDAFQQILKLGDVISKSITAEDVTESYLALDLRLETARATRDRLVALLAKSTDPYEKLSLLREIQRVSEEIDRLENQVRTLKSLAADSRITAELVPRAPLVTQGPAFETSEFAWIRGLTPFDRKVMALGDYLKLPVPDGMVALDLHKRFVAESADGARIWAVELDNVPAGDTAFWMDAVKQRLAPDYASAEVQDVGGYKVLRLVERSDDPYIWWIGLRAEGDDLDLVEVLFPTKAHEQKHGDAVRTAITGEAS